jgi:arylsulfatase A-like enzyme
MNFQAVSVGQKLPKAGPGDDGSLVGGYTDAAGTPSNGLALQLAYVDKALSELTGALRHAKLLDSTLIIIASKHGQSPIDPATFQALDDDPYSKMPGYAFHIADDASLIWLTPDGRKDNMAAATAYLQKIIKPQGIGLILDRAALSLAFQDPATDDRTPDFIVGVNPGVVYTSGSKIAEHGGMNFNDRNVALLLSNPGLEIKTVAALVQTTQVAPTILKALGYDPNELQAVTIEGTQELPSLPF